MTTSEQPTDTERLDWLIPTLSSGLIKAGIVARIEELGEQLNNGKQGREAIDAAMKVAP